VIEDENPAVMAQMLDAMLWDCVQALSDADLQLPGEPHAAATPLSKLQ
jgi:hypothetical protein